MLELRLSAMYARRDVVVPWKGIRIARRRSNEVGEYGEIYEDIYSCDNRRLFMLRVLGVKSVVATEVAWMGELDSKLRQADPRPGTQDINWPTSDDGICRAREKLNLMLREEMQTGGHDWGHRQTLQRTPLLEAPRPTPTTTSTMEHIVVGHPHVAVRGVRQTEPFICTKFKTPTGVCDMFEFMLELRLSALDAGITVVEPWKEFRIARRPSDQVGEDGKVDEVLYICENSHNLRLFILRVLEVESVVATEVAWMADFDSKQRQADPSAAMLEINWPTNDDGVCLARKKLDEMLLQKIQICGHETIQIRVPHSVCGIVIGAHGTRMVEIENSNDVKLGLQPHERWSTTPRMLDIYGTIPEMACAAIEVLKIIGREKKIHELVAAQNASVEALLRQESLNEASSIELIEVPGKLVGKLIGKQGSTANRLRREHAACRLLLLPQPDKAAPSTVMLGADTIPRAELRRAVEHVISSRNRKRKR